MLIRQRELNTVTPLPRKIAWIRSHVDQILAKLRKSSHQSSDFPCLFAQKAALLENIIFLPVGINHDTQEHDLSDLAFGLREYLEKVKGEVFSTHTAEPLIAIFQPKNKSSHLNDYQECFLKAIQYLIDVDTVPWPTKIPRSPEDEFWTLCFHGTQIFINVSHPAHKNRRSRNLCEAFSLVINPRERFDLVAGENPKGNSIRRLIRSNIDQYDKIERSPLLGHYQDGDLEWPQYMLPDNNDDPPLKCPLRFSRPSERTTGSTMESTQMERTPEPEEMTQEEEACYSVADYSTPHQAFAQEVASFFKRESSNIADIGCGPGDILIRINLLAPQWTLFGIDLSSRMLEIAARDARQRLRQKRANINWVLANVCEIGFPDGHFDGIVSNSVLHHVKDPIAFWKEIKRISHQGTRVLVRDLRRPENPDQAKAITEKHVGNESGVVQAHYLSSLHAAYTTDEVKQQLAYAHIRGLTVTELEDRYLNIQGELAV